MTKLFHIEGWYLSKTTITVLITEYQEVILDRNMFQKWVDENDSIPDSFCLYRSCDGTDGIGSTPWEEFYECYNNCEAALYNYIVIRTAGEDVFGDIDAAIKRIGHKLPDTHLN